MILQDNQELHQELQLNTAKSSFTENYNKKGYPLKITDNEIVNLKTLNRNSSILNNNYLFKMGQGARTCRTHEYIQIVN